MLTFTVALRVEIDQPVSQSFLDLADHTILEKLLEDFPLTEKTDDPFFEFFMQSHLSMYLSEHRMYHSLAFLPDRLGQIDRNDILQHFLLVLH